MIFISHAWTNKPAARRLVEALAIEGVPAWLDEQQLEGGERLRAALHEGIGKADVYLYLVSSAANTSAWVQDELKVALGLECEGKLNVVPVRLAGDDTALPPQLAERLYRDLDVAAGGVARLAHDLKRAGSNAVPEGCRVSATVRLLGGGLAHTLDEARRFSDRARIDVLFLNESYERLDALYWTLSEVNLPSSQGERQHVERAAAIVSDVHKQSRRTVDALKDLSHRYLRLQPGGRHHGYFESGYLEQFRVLLHRLSWNCEYLTHLRDRTPLEQTFVSRRDLPEPFNGHLCQFGDGQQLIGGVRVPRHGHPFSGDSPPIAWEFSSPFVDMLDHEVGQCVGYSIARRFLAGSISSAEMLNPETLQYGLG